MNINLDNQLLEAQTLTLFNQEENFTLASLKLKRILKHKPQNKTQIYDWLANVHLMKNEPHSKTHQKLKKVLLFNDPNYLYIDLTLAQFSFLQKKFEEALIEVKKYLQRRSSDPRGIQLMAKIYFNLGLYADAEKQYLNFLARKPGYPGIYTEIASVYYSLEDFEGTKQSLSKAL